MTLSLNRLKSMVKPSFRAELRKESGEVVCLIDPMYNGALLIDRHGDKEFKSYSWLLDMIYSSSYSLWYQTPGSDSDSPAQFKKYTVSKRGGFRVPGEGKSLGAPRKKQKKQVMCVTLSQDSIDRIRAYCQTCEISVSEEIDRFIQRSYFSADIYLKSLEPLNIVVPRLCD